jgi:signal peptidase I
MAERKKRPLGRVLLVVLVLILVVPTLLRLFVVEAFRIPAGSMIPTLLVGDHIFVSKTGYTPRRGDVVVFAYPEDETKDFIKRIVALGGDTIEVRDNQIHLNGKPIPRRRLPGACTYEEADEESGQVEQRPCVAYEERLDENRFTVIQDADPVALPPPPMVKVPAGHVFVMGDNRDNSHDSRFWGGVPVANIKGKASVIWWSSGPGGTRGDRFWKKIHGR